VLAFSKVISIDLLGIDEVTVDGAYTYILITMPGFFFLTQNALLGSYCNGQKELMLPFASTVGGFAVHICMLPIFVTWLDMGLTGVAIATSIHLFSRFAICHCLIMCNKRFGKYYKENLWKEAMLDLWPQFWFCLKSTPLSALPWWGADAFTFIASQLSTDVLAAQTILRNITLLTFMFPVGIAIATGILVANFIGADQAAMAKRKSKLAAGFSMMWVVIILGTLNLFKMPIITLFNDDPKVIEIINNVWFLLNLYIFFDISQGMFLGVIRGLGIQPRASFVPLVGYWILGIPIAALLVFNYGYTEDLNGIYMGMAVAISFNFVVYMILIFVTNWQKQCDAAVKRKVADKKKVAEAEAKKKEAEDAKTVPEGYTAAPEEK
jgi:MATE family multidrug resistance protein